MLTTYACNLLQGIQMLVSKGNEIVPCLPRTTLCMQVLYTHVRLAFSSLPADLSPPWHSRVVHVLLNSILRNHVHAFCFNPIASKERTNAVTVALNFVHTLQLQSQCPHASGNTQLLIIVFGDRQTGDS